MYNQEYMNRWYNMYLVLRVPQEQVYTLCMNMPVHTSCVVVLQGSASFTRSSAGNAHQIVHIYFMIDMTSIKV